MIFYVQVGQVLKKFRKGGIVASADLAQLTKMTKFLCLGKFTRLTSFRQDWIPIKSDQRFNNIYRFFLVLNINEIL